MNWHGEWRKSQEYAAVIKPLVKALRKRSHKTTVKEGVWSKDFLVTIDKGPSITVRVSQMMLRGTKPRWLVLVGEHDYLGPQRKRFHEPKAGFDFEAMACAVELKTVEERDRRTMQAKVVADDLKNTMQLRKLSKTFREYAVGADHNGFSMELRCTTIEQVTAVLQAARSTGVEP